MKKKTSLQTCTLCTVQSQKNQQETNKLNAMALNKKLEEAKKRAKLQQSICQIVFQRAIRKGGETRSLMNKGIKCEWKKRMENKRDFLFDVYFDLLIFSSDF